MNKEITSPKDRLIVALDVDNTDKALGLVEKLKNDVRFFKVGFELFSSTGPGIIEPIREKGCDIFLDLKFHDIPNTAVKASVAITKLGVYMFNVHALGGYDMMKEVAEAVENAADRAGVDQPKILAVTILTSMDAKALKALGIGDSMKEEVLRLAVMAKDAGLDGVVASPSEAKLIRKKLGEDFLIVTPGVRPALASAHDQKRIATPKNAIKDGADFIVVGRPITEAKDPAAAARQILEEIKI